MNGNIRPGDEVQLKSGGPTMTAQSETDGNWFCQWFDRNGELKGGSFTTPILKKVTE